MTDARGVDYWLVARCGQPTEVVMCPEGESPTAAGVVPYGRRVVDGPFATCEGAYRAAESEDAFRRLRGPNTVWL